MTTERDPRDIDTPSFAAAPSERPRAERWVWIGCGVLLVTLIAMLLVAGRTSLAADARTRPLAERACAVLGYELARRRLDVGATLAEDAPRPVIVHTDAGAGDSSALSTLLMAQLLPQLQSEASAPRSAQRQVSGAVNQAAQRAAQAVQEKSQG